MKEYKVIFQKEGNVLKEQTIFAYSEDQAYDLGKQKLFDFQEQMHDEFIAYTVTEK